MRGKAGLVQIVGRLRRITPACAGKSTCMAQSLKPREHHPRVCGEKQKSGIFPFRLVGSPPRMRGKAFLCVAQAFAGGITPAYAGKSPSCVALLLPVRDHPRVCGEKAAMISSRTSVLGSPPRMRGKVQEIVKDGRRYRITPAYAGKSQGHTRAMGHGGDHPRVCGEKQ